MSTVKSFAVGNGDMFYIRHGSDNFTIIDCFLCDDNRRRIVDDILEARRGKNITRFISTHADDDHLRGLCYLDDKLGLLNFYCVKNATTKDDETEDFSRYCSFREDSDKVFHISRGCSRRWMNRSSDERDSAGIHIEWPICDNEHYKKALAVAADGGSPNNTSAVIRYSVEHGASFLWMGDLETEFMEKIADAVKWPKVDIIFAAHHGRQSGRIPHSLLDQLQPSIIVLGEAPSRHLHYYGGYNTLTQNTAGDITFECVDDKVHIFVGNREYEADFLDFEPREGPDNYLGTLTVASQTHAAKAPAL